MVGQGAGAGRSQGGLISSSLGMKVAGRQQKFQAGVQDIKISGIFPSTHPPPRSSLFPLFLRSLWAFPYGDLRYGPSKHKGLCVYLPRSELKQGTWAPHHTAQGGGGFSLERKQITAPERIKGSVCKPSEMEGGHSGQ